MSSWWPDDTSVVLYVICCLLLLIIHSVVNKTIGKLGNHREVEQQEEAPLHTGTLVEPSPVPEARVVSELHERVLSHPEQHDIMQSHPEEREHEPSHLEKYKRVPFHPEEDERVPYYPEEHQLYEYVSVFMLGKGTFGEVYKCYKRGERGCKVALKMMNGDAKGEICQKWRNEAEVLKTLKGMTFFLQITDSFDYLDFLYCIVTEFVTKTTLAEVVLKRPVLQTREVQFYLAELIVAIETLHKKHIVHRDVKPRNVLIDEEGHIVLADFGEAASLAPYDEITPDRHQGTLAYNAPEALNKKPVNHMVDWWSFAVTAHFTATKGELPFGSAVLNREELFDAIVSKAPNIKSSLPESFKELLQEMLVKDVKTRLGYRSVDDIISHPFFHPVDWDAAFARKLQPSVQPNEIERTPLDQLLDFLDDSSDDLCDEEFI